MFAKTYSIVSFSAELDLLLSNSWQIFRQFDYSKYLDQVIKSNDYFNSIDHNTMTIQIFEGNRYYYFLRRFNNEVSLVRFQTNNLDNLTKIILNNMFFGNMRSAQINKASLEICSFLFKDIEVKNLDFLTIIPDGTLNYLPFELLLTEDVDTTKPINWFDLPYLFKKVNINYQYSARLAAMDRETNPKNNGVLAFAPKYKGYVSDDRAFGNLIYNQRELESIKKYFPGEFYGGADADKKTFLEKASDFKVIHLASHAMADNENPELSSLFFTDINQDSTQSPLYPYEIQSTPLNADLVVLSACQSGTGKLHRGEGVFSLARNFIAAGAKSVVNSLWKVDDESTSRLMGYFYENLAKGQRKSEALRNAKLTFLENADAMTSHPYFWSGFVLIGDDSPIVKKSNKIWWIPGGLLLLIAVGWITHKRINPKVFLYQAA